MQVNDATKEKNDSHAGKVVERHWYERNKHVFPATRWEVGGRRGSSRISIVQQAGRGLICRLAPLSLILPLSLPCRCMTQRRRTIHTPHMIGEWV